MNYRKLAKIQRKHNRQPHNHKTVEGTGHYLFVNNTKSDVFLPSKIGRKTIRLGIGGQFEGDSYYLQFVPTIIRILENLDQKKEEIVPEKLILDQPDMIKEEGKVEHVVVSPKKLEEQLTEEPQKEILLNEKPDNDGFVILG